MLQNWAKNGLHFSPNGRCSYRTIWLKAEEMTNWWREHAMAKCRAWTTTPVGTKTFFDVVKWSPCIRTFTGSSGHSSRYGASTLKVKTNSHDYRSQSMTKVDTMRPKTFINSFLWSTTAIITKFKYEWCGQVAKVDTKSKQMVPHIRHRSWGLMPTRRRTGTTQAFGFPYIKFEVKQFHLSLIIKNEGQKKKNYGTKCKRDETVIKIQYLYSSENLFRAAATAEETHNYTSWNTLSGV